VPLNLSHTLSTQDPLMGILTRTVHCCCYNCTECLATFIPSQQSLNAQIARCMLSSLIVHIARHMQSGENTEAYVRLTGQHHAPCSSRHSAQCPRQQLCRQGICVQQELLDYLFLPQIGVASSLRRMVMLLRFRALMHACRFEIDLLTTLDIARKMALTAAPH